MRIPERRHYRKYRFSWLYFRTFCFPALILDGGGVKVEAKWKRKFEKRMRVHACHCLVTLRPRVKCSEWQRVTARETNFTCMKTELSVMAVQLVNTNAMHKDHAPKLVWGSEPSVVLHDINMFSNLGVRCKKMAAERGQEWGKWREMRKRNVLFVYCVHPLGGKASLGTRAPVIHKWRLHCKMERMRKKWKGRKYRNILLGYCVQQLGRKTPPGSMCSGDP